MRVPVKTLFLVALILLAGCGSPQTADDDNESGPAEDTPLTDNDAGAEPSAPANGTNTSNATENATSANESDANETSLAGPVS